MVKLPDMEVAPPFSRPPFGFRGNIARFVEDDSYSIGFGLQWKKWTKTQFDSHTGVSITEDRAKRMFGNLFDEIPGSLVLEAGCGAGRFSEVLLKNYAILTAFDLTQAVETNYSIHRDQKNFRVFQGSIFEIPFALNSFDFVFCPGVVQHTPNPRKSIESLWGQVKPGGWLVFDQYRFNLSTLTRTAWVFRIFLRRINPERAMIFTNLLVKSMLPVHKRVHNNKVLEKILFRISPITAHHSSYKEFSDELQNEWAQLNTHDNLTDFHKKHTTVKRAVKILKRLHAFSIEVNVMPYTVEIRAQKPSRDNENFSPKVVIKKSRGVSG